MARNEGQIALRDGAPKELAEKYTREKLWLRKTVFDILAAQAAAHPDRIAIKDHKGPSAMAR